MPPQTATRASKRTKPPIGELGAPGIVGSLSGWLDTYETTPELTWPNNIRIYELMRHDAHLDGALDATHLPIERSNWDLTADSLTDCRPEVIQLVREDLGLGEKGTHLRRPRGGVVFADFLRHALLEDIYGHMVFEQVYEIAGGLARLRKLAPRMPRTIYGWGVAYDGGLDAIRQLVPEPQGAWRYVDIPIDRLVVFTRRKEGSDPTGRSVLRASYIHWRIKQDLIKVDAIAGERNGLGIPVMEYDPALMTPKQALDISSNLRTGEYAGIALEQNSGKLTIEGVTGQIRDVIASIKYHDQEMARSMLAMFLDLGQEKGARNLGETFVDFFVMALQAKADHIADVINEHVIRDLVELNYGPGEPYPLVRCDEITGDTDLTADAMKALADGGYIIPDPALEEFLRKRYKMPSAGLPYPLEPQVPIGEPPPDPEGTGPMPLDGGTLGRLQARFAELTAGPRVPRSRVRSGQ